MTTIDIIAIIYLTGCFAAFCFIVYMLRDRQLPDGWIIFVFTLSLFSWALLIIYAIFALLDYIQDIYFYFKRKRK